ncbi:MAG: carboxypeptidase regulatory-like domain-containing protein, partial [Acidobacteria bacterium]|nr:carboxypeptidase regulatory-like domain-containing protein [Acidobacteriota bacterium]
MSKNPVLRLLAAVMLAGLACAVGVFGQGGAGTGSISGVVTDQNGGLVANASVTVTSKATNKSETVVSNSDGLYRFDVLQPGDYTIKVVAKGFSDLTLEATVQVGRVVDA